MRYADPLELACPSCDAKSSFRVRELLNLSARCVCGNSLESVGRDMRLQVAEARILAALVDTVMAIEAELQVQITDDDLTTVRTGLDLLTLCMAKTAADATRRADLAECVRSAIEKARRKPTSEQDLERPLATVFVDQDFDFAAGYSRRALGIPDRWRDYACADYYDSPLATSGWWDEAGQCWYIEPSERIREDREREFLIIGRPGVDGIEWGYRRGHRGIWAHYPIEDHFVLIADSATSLKEGYGSGQITV